jgi:hypothetical protein
MIPARTAAARVSDVNFVQFVFHALWIVIVFAHGV